VQTIADSLSAATLRLLDAVGDRLPSLAAALLAIVAFWTAAKLVWRGLIAADRFVGRPTMARVAAGLTYWVILGAGVVVSLDVLGVNAQSLATGLGLGGVALGFALRDIVSNMVAGVLIISSQEFRIGDQIVVADTEGTVERIELRATYLRTTTGAW
jgi:small-conductance mechanosensitive channel